MIRSNELHQTDTYMVRGERSRNPAEGRTVVRHTNANAMRGARAHQTSAWRRTYVDVIRENEVAEAREVTCTFTYISMVTNGCSRGCYSNSILEFQAL